MSQEQKHSSAATIVSFAPLAAGLTLLLWLYALAWAWSGYPIYRDQHLGAAIEYARNGVDFLRPVIVGFNANETGTPQELPIWQAVASYGLKMFGGWWGGATIVSLLLFTVFLPLLRQAAKWETGDATAWLVVALLIAQPVVFQTAGGAQTDGLSLALLIGFVWSAERLRRSPGTFSWVLCAGLASLLAVTKFPFLLAGASAAVLMLVWSMAPPRSWILLATAGFVAAAVVTPWTRWSDAEIGRALFKYRPMTMMENPEWFFGSLSYRLDPANYIKAGWRALSCLWGSFVLIGLTLYGIWLRPRSLGTALLIGALLTTLIFTKLVLIHRHYYLMFAPAVALLNGYALADLLGRLGSLSPVRAFATKSIVACGLLLALVQGLMGIEALVTDDYMRKAAGILRQHTGTSERLVVINGGWGGDLLIHAERKGLSADDTKLVEDPETRRQLLDLGFTKIVYVSQSPLLHAVQVTNPGSSDLERIRWSSFVSPEAEKWATVFQSEDILIKDIPGQ